MGGRKATDRMTLDPALTVAYREADYVVYDEHSSIVTRIDRPSPPLANLLAARGAAGAALLTACNPRSQELAMVDNVARQQQLCGELRRLQLNWLSAVGRSADGQWQEASLLALDLPSDQAMALCRQFEQHAWVRYDAEGRGQLVVTDLPAAAGDGSAR